MTTIALLGTFDTKGAEYDFVRRCIQSAGCEALLMDLGFGGPPTIRPDIDANAVLHASGCGADSLASIDVHAVGRSKMLSFMASGASALLQSFIQCGSVQGAFGMGGGGGTNLLSEALRPLPRGFPKLILSTILCQNLTHQICGSDIVMMNSITDIAGLNQVTCVTLSRAAFAIAGMAKAYGEYGQSSSNRCKGGPIL